MESTLKKNLFFGFLAVAFNVLILFMCIFTGRQSYGMEGDEVFSFISSTSQGGFKEVCFLDDQTWYEGSYFYNSLTAEGSERFNIPMVFENQAMDTHPPLFYVFLNIVCSFFPGQFSKWFGVGLNIFFLLFVEVGCFLLLNYYIKNKYASLVLSVIFCCSGLSIEMVLFIRMYVLLMACFLFQSWYHLLFYDWSVKGLLFKKDWKKYILLGILTILGALTHYYFLTYQLIISAFFVLLLWRKHQVRQCIDYIITMIVSAILYCCLYPASLNHIFFKYRGRDAVHKFLKTSSLFGDVFDMFNIFNKGLFKGSLLILLGIMLIASFLLVIRNKFQWQTFRVYLLLIIPSIIYFWGISKASPFISFRYISPVAALIYIFLILWMNLLWKGISPNEKIGYVLCGIIMSLSVFFFPVRPVTGITYTERAQVVKELSGECEYCAYITGDEYNWKMWDDFVLYPEFEGLFFISGIEKAPITDEKFLSQENLILFIDKALDQNEIIAYLREAFPELTYELKYEEPNVNILYVDCGTNSLLTTK